MRRVLLNIVTVPVLVLMTATAARAATITIDDTDLDTITITVDGFISFFLDGGPLANGVSTTLPDTGHTFEGAWDPLGAPDGEEQVNVLFSLPGDPTAVTSGTEFEWYVGLVGTSGTLTGTFGGFVGSPYFSTSESTLLQGQTGFGFGPVLSVTFVSEPVAAPEPATLSFLALGLTGAAAQRWRKRRRA